MPRETQINIHLDPDLHKKLRILLADPSTGRLKYGGLSALVNSLLLNWTIKELEARNKKGSTT